MIIRQGASLVKSADFIGDVGRLTRLVYGIERPQIKATEIILGTPVSVPPCGDLGVRTCLQNRCAKAQEEQSRTNDRRNRLRK